MGYPNVKIVGADQTKDMSAPPGASLIVVTSPAKLYSVTIFNSGPDQYYMLFDAVALPANATVPVIPPVKVPADSQGFIDFGDGRQFNAGIVICNSTTIPGKTLGANDSWISANFRKTSG